MVWGETKRVGRPSLSKMLIQVYHTITLFRYCMLTARVILWESLAHDNSVVLFGHSHCYTYETLRGPSSRACISRLILTGLIIVHATLKPLLGLSDSLVVVCLRHACDAFEVACNSTPRCSADRESNTELDVTDSINVDAYLKDLLGNAFCLPPTPSRR